MKGEAKARRKRCPLCSQAHPVAADPREGLAGTAGEIRELTRGLPRAKLLLRPAPGKWSIHEIVCHLADVEVANAWRCRKVLAGEELGPTPWSQDAWAASLQYRALDFRKSLERFRILRESHLALLTAVGRRGWGKTVACPGAGRISAAMIAVHLAFHDANHLERIAEIRAWLRGRRA